jgi:dethiobiotin synthetase
MRYGVAVVKPAQTGPDSDVDTVAHLAAPALAQTLASFPDPLAPLAAARVAALEPLDLYAVTDAIKEISAAHELTLVEGAGGLLVPMGLRPGGAPWTIADLAVALGVPTVVVVRAGLGTLNHTALTLEALERRGVPAHVVIGAWPGSPELVHFTNLDDLPGALHGLLPEGAGSLAPGVFRRSAPGWLTPDLYGSCDNLHDLTDAV